MVLPFIDAAGSRDSRSSLTAREAFIRQLRKTDDFVAVSYTHLRAHETVLDLVCRLLLEKKKQNIK